MPVHGRAQGAGEEKGRDEAEQERRRYSLIALAGGVAVAIVIVMSKG